MLRTSLRVTFRQQVRCMFIQTESTPNEHSLKFRPGKPVMAVVSENEEQASSNVIELSSSVEAARRSPLAARLFRVNGVESVFLGPDFITVTKQATAAWPHVKPDVYAAIVDHYTSGEPLLSPHSRDANNVNVSSTTILADDTEVVQLIKELLETRIRPVVQEDGGDIEYRGFDPATGIVRLKLRGACRTCSSSAVTLQHGIEGMLRHYIPEVRSVQQDLDESERVSQAAFSELEARIEGTEK